MEESGDTVGLNVNDRPRLLPILIFVTLILATVTGCTISSSTEYISQVVDSDVGEAHTLIAAYRELNWGVGDSKAFFSTYEIVSSQKIGSTITLVMSPMRPKPGDTLVVNGSAVRYVVNLASKAVEEVYLE